MLKTLPFFLKLKEVFMANQSPMHELIDVIDLQIQSKHLLKHEFYQAWSAGKLSMDCLRHYAKEYYQHVKAFPTYLSAVHSRCDDAATRRVLLQNLIEEEAGSPNHPELWKNFATGLGVSEAELASHQPSEEMQALITTFREICYRGTIAEGIAALYAYESQIPEICVSKIDGLKKYYGVKNPKVWEYFAVHIEADKAHAAQEKQLLSDYQKLVKQETVESAVNQALQALWDFLTGIQHRYFCTC